jgi:hypothetical protein
MDWAIFPQTHLVTLIIIAKSGIKKVTIRFSGADVVITNFCNFYPFSAKKIGVFSQKNNVMINIFKILAVAKNANFFAKCFGEKN